MYPDHIHVLVEIPPKIAVSSFNRVYISRRYCGDKMDNYCLFHHNALIDITGYYN